MDTAIVSASDLSASEWAAALPWLTAAAGPYGLAMLGTADRLSAAYRDWIVQPDSEVSFSRAWLLVRNDRVIGGYVALAGTEVVACRKSDMFRMLRLFDKAEGREFRSRLIASQGLFAPVPPDCFYLSKIGVLPEHCGHGHGRTLLDHYCRNGQERGAATLRLDVSCHSVPALALYRRHGFVPGFRSDWQDICYMAMTRNLRGPAEDVSPQRCSSPSEASRGRDGSCDPPPAPIPACPIRAPGSYLG